MASARNSLRATSLQSGVPEASSRYSRIVVLSCNRVVMESTLVAMTSESNDVTAFCYFFEISTTRHLTGRGEAAARNDTWSATRSQQRLAVATRDAPGRGSRGGHRQVGQSLKQMSPPLIVDRPRRVRDDRSFLRSVRISFPVFPSLCLLHCVFLLGVSGGHPVRDLNLAA